SRWGDDVAVFALDGLHHDGGDLVRLGQLVEDHGVDYIDDVIFYWLVRSDEIAAVVVEFIQGEGGYIVFLLGWLKKLRDRCTKHGSLFVTDEIQSRMGRTGKMWAVEHTGVVPDIVLAGKGIASGMPLGAMIARADLIS